MPPTDARARLAWLADQPSLEELREAFPDQWRRARADLQRAAADGPEGLRSALAEVSARRPGRDHHGTLAQRAGDEARRQMLLHTVERALLRAESGVHTGTVRLGLVQGTIAQRLLFRRDLERRPVNRTLFRLVWPLLTQRRRIMPLVRKRGIYCFYSSALVRALARIIDGRQALEIAAGDGTLTTFLRERGVAITATDDHSWSREIDYPEHVVDMDAATALRHHRPEVVVCSWPPVGNAFEAAVFRTPSVQTYVVIGASSQGTGSWDAYRAQTDFDVVEDARLAALVLPPEHTATVLVFTRRAG